MQASYLTHTDITADKIEEESVGQGDAGQASYLTHTDITADKIEEESVGQGDAGQALGP
jgi:hypothetical protein